MDKTILTLGTTPAWQRTMVFERFTLDAVNRSSNVVDYASGKSINAARVLNALGERVIAASVAGGVRGRLMQDDLDRSGIRHDLQTVDAPTRQCITVIDRSTRTATELVEESLPMTPLEWEQFENRVRRLLPQCAGWIFTGSLPPDGPVDLYARFLTAAGEASAFAIIDARGESMRHAMKLPGAIAKLNREELADTIGKTLSSDADVRSALVSIVPQSGAAVVTLGAEGSLASDGRSVWRVSSPQVATISAVGSGDSYAAGLASGLSRGWDLPESCALGAACGAANAMTALAGHLDPAMAEQLRTQVRIDAI